MGAYEIYERQNEECAKKYRLFRYSFFAFWSLSALILLSIIFSGAQNARSGLIADSALPWLVALIFIDGLLYLYLLVFLISATGKDAISWVLGVIFFSFFGILVSYYRMKLIADDKGWVTNRLKSLPSIQAERTLELQNLGNRKVNIRVGLERISAVFWCGLGGLCILYFFADALGSQPQRSPEWAALIFGLVLILFHFLTRWIIRGFLPKE